MTIGETDRYVTYIWRKDDNSEIVRTNIPVVSDGVTMFKSFVFKRSQNQPATPTTGSYVEPVPYAEGWSDGIPEGEYRVWMSSRVFSSDDRLSSWSTPSPMTDTETDDYAYSSSETKPSAPTEHGVQSSSDWHNDPTENDIWMAHDRKINGVWQGWQIMRIKGEQGRKGNKGDSFDEAKYYFKSTKKDASSPSVSLSNGVPTGWSTNIADTNWGEMTSNGFHYWLWQVVVETVVGNGGNKTYKAQEVQMIDEYDPKRTGVTETYCSNNDANTHPTSGWTTLSSARANFGKNNQYLWKREVRTYSDDSTEAFYSIFEKYAEPGATGPRGKMVRPCGIYNSSRKYYNTDKYVDVVIGSNGNRYMVNEGKTEVPVNTPPPNTTFWTEANEFDFVASKVAFFERSYIENLSLNNAEAGYVDEVSKKWVKKASLSPDGTFWCQGAEIQGNITTYYPNSTMKRSEYNGNGDGTMIYYYPIIKMTVCAYKWINVNDENPVPDIKNCTVDNPRPSSDWLDSPGDTHPSGMRCVGYYYTIFSDPGIPKIDPAGLTNISLTDYPKDQSEQVKMKEELFVYDSNGNAAGMQTIYYNKNGTVKWVMKEDGTLGSNLQYYWKLTHKYYFANTTTQNGIYLALQHLNKSTTTAPYKLPDSDTFSIFSSANATSPEIVKYDGFCYKGSTTSDSPENLTGFSGVITSQSQAKLMPVLQDNEELTYFFNFDVYNDGKFMGKATLTKVGNGNWMSNKLIL